jgi:hypothetical protein
MDELEEDIYSALTLWDSSREPVARVVIVELLHKWNTKFHGDHVKRWPFIDVAMNWVAAGAPVGPDFVDMIKNFEVQWDHMVKSIKDLQASVNVEFSLCNFFSLCKFIIL